MAVPTRVLVCDDQVLIRTGFATIIDAQPDLEVVGDCGDGRAAVDLARRLNPDVVVMDVRMPVLDGIEATRLRAGASGFLLKDAPAAQLLNGIRTVASGAALTPRELEVLRLIANGLSNGEIAATLVISQETVKTYVSRLLAKLGLRDRVQAVVHAYRSGLVT
ncbi:response regulator transcription factor [Promicromonospora sp. NPDC023805]|uniref:response regulator transcription factor n=1 Tax=Promicromonospora sp. NPDC023805 TaxID=3154696 RepID=UPI0033C77E24